MPLEDLMMSFFTLLGFATMLTFAITGIKSAWDEIQKEKKESRSLDDHFNSIVRN